MNDYLRRYPNFWKVLYFSTVQMVFQSISNSVMGITSQISIQNNIWWAGPVSTMLLFAFSGIGALYNNYVDKYQYRYNFFFGATGYIVYCSSTIVFVTRAQQTSTGFLVVALLVNVIGGLVLSVFYVSSFNYINKCAVNDNAAFYFGINLGIVQSANALGSLLSAYTIEPLGQQNYSIMMTLLVIGVSLLFLLVREVDLRNDQQPQTNQNQTINLVERPGVELNSSSMIRMLPSFFLLGLVIAFIYSFLSTLMERTFGGTMTDLELNSLTFKIFIFEGLGQLAGGIAFISMADMYPKKKMLLAVNKLFTLSVVFTLTGYFLQNIYLMGCGVMLFGFVDCCAYSLDLAIVSEENWGKRGFSIFNIAQCSGVVVSILGSMFVSTELFIFYCAWTGTVASVFLVNFKSRLDSA